MEQALVRELEEVAREVPLQRDLVVNVYVQNAEQQLLILLDNHAVS